jgi:hypothetical protein
MEEVMGATVKREPQTRLEQAEYVVERLTEFAVRINPSSRIGKMLRVLRRPGIIEPEDPDYAIVLESIRDMYQLRLIVDTMGVHRQSPEFRVAADLLRKDLALPQDNLKDTPGRNTSSSSTSPLSARMRAFPHGMKSRTSRATSRIRRLGSRRSG